MHRVFQQIPLFVQKAEVHAPGIHADAVHASISLCFDQSLLDLMEETQHIPVHRTVYYDRIIGKTVYFLCRDLIPVKGSQHDPAAGSAKVHCKDFRFFFGYIHSVSSVSYLYSGPYVWHALKSWPSLSMPKAFHAAGRNIFSSGTLCIATGILNIEHMVIRSAPIWP